MHYLIGSIVKYAEIGGFGVKILFRGLTIQKYQIIQIEIGKVN